MQNEKILWGFQTRPLIQEQVLDATKALMTEEIIPDVTLQINDVIQTAMAAVEKRVAQEIAGLNQKVTLLQGYISSKDTEIGQLKQRLNVILQSSFLFL